MKTIVKLFMTVVPTILAAGSLFAETGATSSDSNAGYYAIAAALAIGLPAIGGTLAQGRAAAAALEGIARNPGASGKIFVPMILGMALIESLVLFGLIMAFILSGKIG